MVAVKTQIQFEISEDGELSLKVAGIAATDHAAMDKMLNDLATAIGGDRQNKEPVNLVQIATKQTLTQ